MNDLLNKISLLSEIAHKSYVQPCINVSILVVSVNDAHVFESSLIREGIKCDKIGNDKLEIELSSIDISTNFSVDEENFLKECNYNSSILAQKNIVILVYNDSFLFFEHNTNQTCIGGNLSDTNFLIENTKSYLNFRDFLRGSEFPDYFNSLNDQIVFYTASKGVLKLSFPSIPIKLDNGVNFSELLDSLVDHLKNKDYSIHFKNSLFNLEKKAGYSQIQSLFENINSLIQETDNNYQLQLKNFSFDKLKGDLKKEKEKYFNSLREILSKIFSQIVGVPISIAASTFASYKVDNQFVICLILVAFSIYTCFTIFLQYIYRKDILEIEKDFNKDFDRLKNDSGLPEKDIIEEKDKIVRRIRDIKRTICIFIISVLTLASLLVGFLISQLFADSKDNSKTINLKSTYTNIILGDSLSMKSVKEKPNVYKGKK